MPAPERGTAAASSPALLWLDVSAGVAGDMLLAALLDLGADPAAVDRAVEAVLPGEVRLTTEPTRRAGMRALRLRVEPTGEGAGPGAPHRAWEELRGLLERAGLPEPVRVAALAAFTRLAEAEGHVHGVAPEQVHFHEVGGWDSVADVVGVAAALHDLGRPDLRCGPVRLGGGTVRAAHGSMPVPVPAVLQLLAASDLMTLGGEQEGELATPTGVALLAALAAPVPGLPAGRVRGVGVGAGSREVEGRANVVRAVLVDPEPAGGEAAGGAAERLMVLLACNVDDLDPRAWPSVLDDLLAAGARDAWLTPVLMKKGRPAHTLQVLVDADPPSVAAVQERLWRATPTLGIRRSTVARVELDRQWRPVTVPGLAEPVRVKLGLQGGRVRTATPEYEDCAALARQHDLPVAEVLARAAAAARDAGLVPGATVG